MKILSISSILPIPGVIKNNDFVFETHKYYNQIYKDDTIVIIKPVRYNFNLVKVLKKNTRLIILKDRFSSEINDYRVEIFPFLSTWSIRNLHCLLTSSIFYFNIKRIKKLFSENKFDIIHAQYIYPDGLLAYLLHKKYNIPYFVTSHNEKFYFDSWLSKKIALKVFKNAAEVLPLNHTNYVHYKSLGVENIEILPIGFNENFLREQKTTKNETISIFTASVLVPLKNIDKVLRAIKKLVPVHKLHYTVIGTGNEKEALIKLTNELGLNDYVTFIDHIPYEKIADEMYKHDIFIMTSFFETFGRVYFEAMAMGIPVICAKKSGISGLFKEMEEGISVDHKNIDEIAEALKYLIVNNEERLRIGKNGQNFVKQYSWENIVRILHHKYQNALTYPISDPS